MEGRWLVGVNVPFQHKYVYIRDDMEGRIDLEPLDSHCSGCHNEVHERIQS